MTNKFILERLGKRKKPQKVYLEREKEEIKEGHGTHIRWHFFKIALTLVLIGGGVNRPFFLFFLNKNSLLD